MLTSHDQPNTSSCADLFRSTQHVVKGPSRMQLLWKQAEELLHMMTVESLLLCAGVKRQGARSLGHTTWMTTTLFKNRVCSISHCSDTSSNSAAPQSSGCTGLVKLLRFLQCSDSGKLSPHRDVYIKDSVNESHMWNFGRLVHLLQHRHLSLYLHMRKCQSIKTPNLRNTCPHHNHTTTEGVRRL